MRALAVKNGDLLNPQASPEFVFTEKTDFHQWVSDPHNACASACSYRTHTHTNVIKLKQQKRKLNSAIGAGL